MEQFSPIAPEIRERQQRLMKQLLDENYLVFHHDGDLLNFYSLSREDYERIKEEKGVKFLRDLGEDFELELNAHLIAGGGFTLPNIKIGSLFAVGYFDNGVQFQFTSSRVMEVM